MTFKNFYDIIIYMKKELIEIAQQIAKISNQAEKSTTAFEDGFDKDILELMKGLSLKDLLEIDIYIQKNNLLTK